MFEKGSRVCFLGDSITAMGKWIGGVFEYYCENEKDNAVTFYNCGVAGGHAAEAIERLDEDLFSYKPTHVVINFGMNDGKMSLYNDIESVTDDVIAERQNAIEKCIDSIKYVADSVVKYGAKVIFCTPTPYDNLQICDTKNCDYQECLKIISGKVKELSEEFDSPCVDFNGFFSDKIRAFYDVDAKFSIIGEDRVHPNEIGQELLKEYFLDFLGVKCNLDKSYEEWEKQSKLDLSELNLKRMALEAKIRKIAYVKWKLILYHVNNGLSPEQGLQAELDKPDVSENMVSLIELYKENKDKLQDLRAELIKLTNMMIAK